MKVCIPCTEADLDSSRVSVPFDEAPVFAFWDPATDVVTFESNPLAGKEDACACSITRWARKLGADVFLSADLGRRAASRLMAAGVATLQAPIETLGSVLQQFRAGALPATALGDRAQGCRERAQSGHQHREGACCGHGHQGDHPAHRCGHHG